MDDYPSDYVDHNLPLILLSGLGPDPEKQESPSSDPAAAQYPLFQENAIQIFSDFPLLTDPTARAVLDELLAHDASNTPWTGKGKEKAAGTRFRIKRVGRTYNLPPRKANPPLTSLPLETEDDSGAIASLVLHSPLSPLSPGSPTFPDGILTQFWVTKHQRLVPAAFINFLPFTTDYNMASLRDNQLKIEINSLRKDWAASGYKTRFIVALLCEDGDLPSDANERLSSLRKATNLDTKSMFVLRPNPSDEDISAFVKSLLLSLQGTCADYYRDLSKHARRKRNRSTIPPPTAPPTTGTSKTLAFQGWNIRYEFKLGVFAEFRQEMDAACRNYETAYELLFGEEVFETIAGWSPRFNDARMLADVLAIRIIRCLLWTEQTTAALHVWHGHKRRIRDIVDRRGKGTKNYGWAAWEARWSLVMAQLMRRADILTLPSPAASSAEASRWIYTPQDRAFASGEKVSPLELLHHEGYWLSQAAQHTARRRLHAEDIPDEDRVPPSQSPAHQLTNRSNVYDTYLSPEPYLESPLPGNAGVNHAEIMIGLLESSIREFSKRHQVRMVEQLSLQLAKELMRLERWTDALNTLRPLWPTLTSRFNGWWDLMGDFGWTLRECAYRAEDRETVLRAEWELMNKQFPRRYGWKYNIHQSLDGLSSEKPKPAIVLKAGEAVSCIEPTFVFAKSEGNVGEPLWSQLAVTSLAQPDSAPISLAEVKVVFEGGLRSIRILSDPTAASNPNAPCELLTVSLQDSANADPPTSQSQPGKLPSMIGKANLTFSPSQTKVFNLTSIPREAGDVRVASLALVLEEEDFYITYAVADQIKKQSVWWGPRKGGIVATPVGRNRDTSACRILPKPPKVRINTPNLRDNYYTDEQVTLDVQLENYEDEAAEISLEMRLIGPAEAAAKFHWITEPGADAETPLEASAGGDDDTEVAHDRVRRRNIGTLSQGESTTVTVVFTDTSSPADYEVEITASYHLVSDVETPIYKTISFDLSFVRPFEANYQLLPRVHPAPWPDFFHPDNLAEEDGSEVKAEGLHQRWNLNSKMVSFAVEPVIVEEVRAVLVGISGGVVRQIGSEIRRNNPDTNIIRPEGFRESDFLIDIQRLSLSDRQATSLHLGLEIRWRRQDGEGTSTPSSTTLLPVPRFVIPMGEPRVLAAATPSSTLPNFIHLDYILENPSLHFLTFNVTMEASDQFAFSGPKALAVQLVPLSRHTIRYNLLCHGTGRWIQPHLIVIDSYYNKTLRVLPTEGMRADKKGISVWVEPAQDKGG
ncbi:hypothetical protein VTO42DRAFT_6476 [Malbranchea cinnamomea]